MKTKTLLLALSLWFAASAGCFADSFVGTWKMDPAKSNFRAALTSLRELMPL